MSEAPVRIYTGGSCKKMKMFIDRIIMKTSNIRPVKLMSEQRVALANDVTFLEARSDEFVDVSCPACAERNPKFIYRKFGLNNNKCKCCGTHYISPRP